jgi:5-(carboxyamino)imidazole ribonucleotide synthase
MGIPVAPFAAIAGPQDFDAAIAAAGVPAILKTRRLGYDGKGQVRIGAGGELAAAFEEIGQKPATLEGLVQFDCEVSVILVRGLMGEMRCYDIPVNRHAGGILRTSTVPSDLPEPHKARAISIAKELATALNYVGVLAVEMFYMGHGHMGHGQPEPLLVNEFAPRVHNSGHWTIDACAASQFENHIRAVAGWPLGPTERHSDAHMSNLIGSEVDAWHRLAAEPGACLHLYGKRHARPGRKMGHVTVLKARKAGPQGPQTGLGWTI